MQPLSFLKQIMGTRWIALLCPPQGGLHAKLSERRARLKQGRKANKWWGRQLRCCRKGHTCRHARQPGSAHAKASTGDRKCAFKQHLHAMYSHNMIRCSSHGERHHSMHASLNCQKTEAASAPLSPSHSACRPTHKHQCYGLLRHRHCFIGPARRCQARQEQEGMALESAPRDAPELPGAI